MVGIYAHVGAPVAACFVVVRRREDSEHPIVVYKLEAVNLALVRPDQQVQAVPVEHPRRDVRPEVAAPAAKGVRFASVLRLWIAPEDVQDLRGSRRRGRKKKAGNGEKRNLLLGATLADPRLPLHSPREASRRISTARRESGGRVECGGNGTQSDPIN